MTGGLTRVGAITRKEFRHLVRDPRSLAVVLLLPVIELVLFAYAISFDVDNLPTVVVDQDHSAASQAYVRTYSASSFFDVQGSATGLAQVDDLFRENRVRAAVVVPAGFGRAVAAGEKAQVAVLVDGADVQAARIGQAYAIALNARYGAQLTAAWADRQGIATTGGIGLLEPRSRTWYNPERRSSLFLIPGLVVVIIMIVTVQQTATSLVRERDLHTYEQMQVSPLRPAELLVGKMLPWTLLAFLDLSIIVALGLGVFGVPLRGSVLLLGVASAVFILACLALGLIVSAVSPSMETANVLALMIAFLPSFLLSGLAFPLGSIPVWLRWLSYAFPGRYMVSISHGVFLRGAGFAELWQPLVQLAGYALLVGTVATVLSRRRTS
ncbi:ABC transporter permease [Raineyella fluvialis]|uniref:Transport permease protein n=1 Tax=Raineyella fluvialis TaxID=2662261 RepID=A0A5Q2FCL4_9ACTN|nr:ABC transporter permease [Raineyella fluvialis]QGF24662.1 ABC transporter permease subunit [Raineyella fluvialis]